VDFATYRCDRHDLDRVFGAALRIGITVGGGSVGGEVRNANLNPGLWTFAHFRDCPGNPPPGEGPAGSPVVDYVSHHLDAIVYGDCTGELEFNSAVCPALYGVHFTRQNGRGSAVTLLAHASDTARVDALFDGLAPAGVDFINTNLAAYVPPDQQFVGGKIGSEARFFNTATWGAPDLSAFVNGGKLLFEVACFNSYGPFAARAGTIALTNTRLLANGPGGEELRASDGGRFELTGNTTLRGMRLAPGAPADTVTRRFEAQWAPPAPATHEPPLARWLPAAQAFDGTAGIAIDPANLSPLKAFTVEAWVYPRNWGPSRTSLAGTGAFCSASTAPRRATASRPSSPSPMGAWSPARAVRSRGPASGSTSRPYGTAWVSSSGLTGTWPPKYYEPAAWARATARSFSARASKAASATSGSTPVPWRKRRSSRTPRSTTSC